MLIDWFTVGAQIVNFLILIWLLKRFLYGPITNAMKKRSERIAQELHEAKRSREQAEAGERRLAEDRAELEHQKDEYLRQAREEVQQWRDTALVEAKDDVEARRKVWLEGLAQEQRRKAEALKFRLAGQVVRISRQMLADLADADGRELERAMAMALLRRIAHMHADDADDAISRHGGSVRVHSGAELDQELRSKLEAALRNMFPAATGIDFGVDADLGLGLRLVAGERKWDWNLSAYLDGVEQQLFEGLLAAPAEEAAAEGAA